MKSPAEKEALFQRAAKSPDYPLLMAILSDLQEDIKTHVDNRYSQAVSEKNSDKVKGFEYRQDQYHRGVISEAELTQMQLPQLPEIVIFKISKYRTDER